jgi:hypothetical protein
MFTPTLSQLELEEKFSHLQKLKYNQFRWWRMYDNINKPLHNRKSLRDKILNGDFDYSHYGYQAMWCEHEINKIYNKCYPDISRFNEESSLLRARRKRLLDDFYKDEDQKLETLIIEFTKNFKCTKEQVLEEISKCLGSLIDLYYILEEKYAVKFQPYPRRGRPKQVI